MLQKIKKVMKSSFLTMCTLAAFSGAAQNQSPENGKFTLLNLPYKTDALQPYISKQTMELHWGKHVQTYIDNVNKLIAGSGFENQSLEEIVKKAPAGGLYNNASQVWNHNFFFASLSPKPQEKPEGKLLEAIDKDFGSVDALKEQFLKTATSLFGSGWVWLVKNKDGHLKWIQTPNGDGVLSKDLQPLLNCDVWEHAYYLDYQNKRADYLNAFWKVVDWKVVGERLK